MNISVTTDFSGHTMAPERQLRQIAEAGFTHLHWCHHYNTDFMYRPCEMGAMRKLVRKLGLKVLDIHGSYGQEKRFWSLREYERQAGAELFKNRAELYCELEATGSLIMHLPYLQVDSSPESAAGQRREMEQAIRTLDEVVPYLDNLGVPLALENMPGDTWELLDMALERYPQTGICYDCGHGNDDRFKHNEEMYRRRARLFAIHLNDNDGKSDLHQSPFMGTVDWKRVAEIVADSPYAHPLSYEICMKATPFQHGPLTPYPSQTEENQAAFLNDAFERCTRFGNMYEETQKARGR